MYPGYETAQLLEQAEVVQIGCPTALARIHGDAKVADFVQCGTADIHGSNDRDLLLRQFICKFVFFENRRVGPTVRPVELCDDGIAFLDADDYYLPNRFDRELCYLGYAVEPDDLEGVEEVLRLQIGVGEGSGIAVHLADDTLRRILSRDLRFETRNALE